MVAMVAMALPADAPLSAQSVADAEAAYARVMKSWSTTRTLQANFDQTITNPILGRTVASRGVFVQERPNRVSITFTEPAGDRIVGDGKSLWVYLPSSTPGQVLKLPADADGAIVADLLGQLLDAPRRTFTITGGERQSIDGRSTRRVQLVPKSPSAVPFSKAVLWLDDTASRRVHEKLRWLLSNANTILVRIAKTTHRTQSAKSAPGDLCRARGSIRAQDFEILTR